MPLLSEVKIRASRPREKSYKVWDDRGLFMLVTPTGARLWRFKYRIDGKGGCTLSARTLMSR